MIALNIDGVSAVIALNIDGVSAVIALNIDGVGHHRCSMQSLQKFA